MEKAQAMIAAYAAAGFSKLHLDASMGAAGEPAALDDARAASRAAALAACAEAAAVTPPVYVIGTEVPTPGGATHALDHLRPTEPDAVLATFGVHARAFAKIGNDAWARVIAIVVQPGVEFGHDSVAIYQPERAAGLSAALPRMPGLVFEAHSTDYQPEASLRRLVQDGFAILKVGPALTFALREALYGLDHIAAVLRPEPGSLAETPGLLAETMERLMREHPAHWQTHYPGTPEAQHVLRHYSYSDRIRYYWPMAPAQAACAQLLDRLGAAEIPPTLVSQYLPRLYDRVIGGQLAADARGLLICSIRDVLRGYARACS